VPNLYLKLLTNKQCCHPCLLLQVHIFCCCPFVNFFRSFIVYGYVIFFVITTLCICKCIFLWAAHFNANASSFSWSGHKYISCLVLTKCNLLVIMFYFIVSFLWWIRYSSLYLLYPRTFVKTTVLTDVHACRPSGISGPHSGDYDDKYLLGSYSV
jgi:hypothetical protein